MRIRVFTQARRHFSALPPCHRARAAPSPWSATHELAQLRREVARLATRPAALGLTYERNPHSAPATPRLGGPAATPDAASAAWQGTNMLRSADARVAELAALLEASEARAGALAAALARRRGGSAAAPTHSAAASLAATPRADTGPLRGTSEALASGSPARGAPAACLSPGSRAVAAGVAVEAALAAAEARVGDLTAAAADAEARADALAAELAAREAELGQLRQVCSDVTHGRKL